MFRTAGWRISTLSILRTRCGYTYVRRCSSIGLRGGISVHGIAGPDKHVVRTVVDTELIDGAALQTQGQKLPSPGGWIHLVAENVTYLHPCHVTPIQDQTNLPRRCPESR